MGKRVVVFITGALFLTGMLSSCTGKEQKVEEITKGFLEAYFDVNYEKAATYCTEELAESLMQTFKSLESLDSQVREMVIANSSKAKTEIIEIDTKSKQDTVIVSYKIFLDNFPGGIDNKLSLVKIGKEWKITGLGL